MKQTYIGLLYLLVTVVAGAQPVVQQLRCEYRTNPPGVDNRKPGLSWQFHTDQRNATQAAYRILVADDSLLLAADEGNMWDSKKVAAATSIGVRYAGKALKSGRRYYWKLMVWDNRQVPGSWSRINSWQMGLLRPGDWKKAAWIGYDALPDTSVLLPHVHGNGKKAWGKRPDILPLLRKEFTITRSIAEATLFICGLGQFELSINGEKTGDHFLDPGWTQYRKHALYVPFNVTRQLQQGRNAIGVMLGNGFYYIPGERYRKMTGAYGYPKMICRLQIRYTDGTQENIVSDASWKAAAGPVVFSSIYGGEDYDATREQPGWNRAGFDDAAWKAAVVTSGPPQLDAQTADPVKIMEVFSPVRITRPKRGVQVYDMGQNAAAIPYIEVRGRAGLPVRLTPGELLKEDGTVTQSNTGGPHTYHYLLRGSGETERWHPQFTYYGFRYLQVETFDTLGNTAPVPEVLAVKSLHVRNAAGRAGHFSCSNNLFNRTDTLIDWAIKSNLMSVMTDCPHREKLGWLEEAHLVGASVRYQYQIAPLCRKIIRDMQMAQTPEGLVPEIAPEFVQFTEPFRDSPEWGSNCILLPWYLYQWYDDRQILEESYPMMQRYVRYLQQKDSAGILKQGLSDWYDIGPSRPGFSQNTPQGLTATAFYYYDLTSISRIAGLLGKRREEAAYAHAAEQVREAFNKQFFNEATRQYGTGSQAANAIAVYMGLVLPQYKAAVVANLVKDIQDRNGALTAGDIGFRYLLRVLEEEGRSDVIYAMNNRSDVPGYGYQLAKGATALTESWQALPTVSNNHFMLGHILEWFYSGLGGIRQLDKGFREIEIRPQPVGDITWVNTSYDAPYGQVTSNWKKEAGVFRLEVVIPANTTALVCLPTDDPGSIRESGQTLAAAGLSGVVSGKTTTIRTGSGTYHFEAKLK